MWFDLIYYVYVNRKDNSETIITWHSFNFAWAFWPSNGHILLEAVAGAVVEAAHVTTSYCLRPARTAANHVVAVLRSMCTRRRASILFPRHSVCSRHAWDNLVSARRMSSTRRRRRSVSERLMPRLWAVGVANAKGRREIRCYLMGCYEKAIFNGILYIRCYYCFLTLIHIAFTSLSNLTLLLYCVLT